MTSFSGLEPYRHGWVDRLNLSQKTVFFSSGEELQFDYIVIACGSSVPFPGKNIICTAHKDKVHVLKKITRNTTNQGCKVSDLNKPYNYLMFILILSKLKSLHTGIAF